MSFRHLGVCSWSLQPQNPDELLARIAESGLSHIQLSLTPLISDRDVWQACLPQLQDAGVGLLSGMMAPVGEDYSTLETIARTGGIRPDATWPANEAMARAMAVLAGAAGLSLVTLHAGFLPHDREDAERKAMIKRLRMLAKIFADQGVRIAFETGQETAATLLEVLDEIDCSTVGVNFDPANMILYGMGDPIESLRQLGPHVFQVHIKDATPADTVGAWGSEVPAGTGAVDWAGFFEVFNGLQDDLDLVIEREAGGKRVGDIQQAVELVHRHLGACSA